MASDFFFIYHRKRYGRYNLSLPRLNTKRPQITAAFDHAGSGGHFKNTYELLNQRALKISMLYKNRIFQCMGKIFCVEF